MPLLHAAAMFSSVTTVDDLLPDSGGALEIQVQH